MFLYVALTAFIIVLGVIFNKRSSWKRWVLTLVLILIANFAAYYITSYKATIRNHTSTKKSEAETRKNFLALIKENQAVVRAILTDQGYLAITVKNDGQDKTAMATYYCQLAKAENFLISSVRILDAADAKYGEGYAYGTELAQVDCN